MPHIRFETEVKETRDEDGHIMRKNVYFAHVTPAGGKDVVVKDAEQWLLELKEKAMVRGAFDQAAAEYEQWHAKVKAAFEQYKAGEEMTTEGTPLRASLAFTKAEIAQAESVKIFSIEDLAEANEEAISRMGMGGRGLKIKAQKLLETKGDVAQENAALRQKISDLEAKMERMLADGFKEPAKRGRKPKEVEAA
ncbi:MAG: hypothetical protein J0H69_16940 [Burkholderiales bacterium]|nr:hypothetical protein [Burkholderiales bacterium]